MNPRSIPAERLHSDGWRQSPKDGLWRNDRFGGAYKTSNALLRIGSSHGELTAKLVHPSTGAQFLSGTPLTEINKLRAEVDHFITSAGLPA